MSCSVGQQKLSPLVASPNAGSFSSFDLEESQARRVRATTGVASSALGGEGGLAGSEVTDDLQQKNCKLIKIRAKTLNNLPFFQIRWIRHRIDRVTREFLFNHLPARYGHKH